MINVNDIIKFSDYKDIYLKSNDNFIYKADIKSYNIKGDKVEKYIFPIFYDLFQPNLVVTLLETIKRKNKEIVSDNFKIEFLNILSNLHKLGLIQILDYNDIKCKNKLCIKLNGVNQVEDEKIINSAKNRKLTILNFWI